MWDIPWFQTADWFLWPEIKYFLVGNFFILGTVEPPVILLAQPCKIKWGCLRPWKGKLFPVLPLQPWSLVLVQHVLWAHAPFLLSSILSRVLLILFKCHRKPMGFMYMHTCPIGSTSTSQLLLLPARGGKHYTDQCRPITFPCKQCLPGSPSCVIYVPRIASSTRGNLSGLK